MGAWGTGISSNDTAMDLRYEYQAAFYYFDVETALKKIDTYVRNEGFDELDEAEWCDYYYSLADYMWKKGILTESIKNHALEMIDSGFGLEIWEETGKEALKERKKVLEKFREKLCSEQPIKKKIKINLYMKPIFEIGDVIAFQLQTLDKTYLSKKEAKGWLKSEFTEQFFRSCDGKWVVMRKAFDVVSYRSSIVPEVQDIWPHFQVYGTIFDECPTIDDLRGIPWTKTKYCQGMGVFGTEGSLYYFKKRNYRVIGSSLENIDIQNKIDGNIDSFYFGSPSDTYNADTIILNSIIGHRKDNKLCIQCGGQLNFWGKCLKCKKK